MGLCTDLVAQLRAMLDPHAPASGPIVGTFLPSGTMHVVIDATSLPYHGHKSLPSVGAVVTACLAPIKTAMSTGNTDDPDGKTRHVLVITDFPEKVAGAKALEAEKRAADSARAEVRAKEEVAKVVAAAAEAVATGTAAPTLPPICSLTMEEVEAESRFTPLDMDTPLGLGWHGLLHNRWFRSRLLATLHDQLRTRLEVAPGTLLTVVGPGDNGPCVFQRRAVRVPAAATALGPSPGTGTGPGSGSSLDGDAVPGLALEWHAPWVEGKELQASLVATARDAGEADHAGPALIGHLLAMEAAAGRIPSGPVQVQLVTPDTDAIVVMCTALALQHTAGVLSPDLSVWQVLVPTASEPTRIVNYTSLMEAIHGFMNTVTRNRLSLQTAVVNFLGLLVFCGCDYVEPVSGLRFESLATGAAKVWFEAARRDPSRVVGMLPFAWERTPSGATVVVVDAAIMRRLLQHIGELPREKAGARSSAAGSGAAGDALGLPPGKPTGPGIAAAAAAANNPDLDILLSNVAFVIDAAAASAVGPEGGLPHFPDSLFVDSSTGVAYYGFYRCPVRNKVVRGLYPPSGRAGAGAGAGTADTGTTDTGTATAPKPAKARPAKRTLNLFAVTPSRAVVPTAETAADLLAMAGTADDYGDEETSGEPLDWPELGPKRLCGSGPK